MSTFVGLERRPRSTALSRFRLGLEDIPSAVQDRHEFRNRHWPTPGHFARGVEVLIRYIVVRNRRLLLGIYAYGRKRGGK